MIAGTFRLPPDQLAAAQSAMLAMIHASRAEDGCLVYHYAEDVFEPGLIHVVERWRDREALDNHFASTHLAAWRARWASLGIGERSLTLIDTDGGEPV